MTELDDLKQQWVETRQQQQENMLVGALCMVGLTPQQVQGRPHADRPLLVQQPIFPFISASGQATGRSGTQLFLVDRQLGWAVTWAFFDDGFIEPLRRVDDADPVWGMLRSAVNSTSVTEEVHWKDGFVAGCAYWDGWGGAHTLTADDRERAQNAADEWWKRPSRAERFQYVGELGVLPSSDGLRFIIGGRQTTLTRAQRSDLARTLGIDVAAAKAAGVGLGLLGEEGA